MSSEESGSGGGGSGGGNGGGGGKASLSALVLSAMAMLGVVSMPGKQGPSAPRSASAPTTSAASSDSSDSSDEEPQAFNGAKLVQQHRAAQDDDKLLPMLEVLDRFQAPRLARTPDQGKRLLGSAKRHIDYLLSGADRQDRMRFMVALVPDPVRSGSAYRYDQALTSMLLAFRRGGYVLDSHDLDHWHRTRTNADAAKSKKRTETGEMVYNSADDDDLRAPGLILLRKLRPPDPNADPSAATGLTDSNDLIVLLLVAETPVRGVHTVMLHNCLDIAMRAWKLQAEKTGPPVRVIGPNFTGTGPSLVRSISAWLAEFKKQNPDGLPDLESGSALISWVNGAAVAIDHGRMMEQFDTLVPGAVTFRATTDSSPELNRALLEYLITIKPLVGGDGLAYLTEETTGFGEASSKAFKAKGSVKSRRLSSSKLTAKPTAATEPSPAADKAQNLKSLEKHFAIYRYTFPAHISEIRKRYQSQDQADQATVKLGDQDLKVKPSERLQFSNDGVDSPEFLASESPGMMAAYDELRLLRMVQDINRRGIRFAVFSATDVRDYLFLASFFREHCPNVQLATLSNDEALTHHEHISSLRGVIVASSYPLWLKDQDIDWSPVPGVQGARLDGTALPDLRVQTLPMNTSFALYNAALVHLIESEPDQDLADFLGSGFIASTWPGSGGQDTVSPIWLSVVGYKGFEPLMLERPLQAQVPGEPGGPPAAEPRRGVAGSFRDSAGRLAMGTLLHERARQKADAKPADAGTTVPAFPLVGKGDADLAWSRYLRWASGTTPLLPLVLALIALICFFVAYQRSHGVHHDLVHAWPLGEPGRRASLGVDLELERELSDRKNDLLGGPFPWLRGVGALVLGLGLLAVLGGLWRGGQDWLAGVGDPRLEGYLQWLGRPLLQSTLLIWVLALVLISRLNRLPGLKQLLAGVKTFRQPHEAGSKRAQKRTQAVLVLLLVLLVQVAAFVLLRMSTIEPDDLWSGVALPVAVLVLFALLLLESAWLLEMWRRYQRFALALLDMPFGQAIDRLPRPLAARFGGYLQALIGEDETNVNPQVQHFRRVLDKAIEESRAEADPDDPTDPLLVQAKQMLQHLTLDRRGKNSFSNLELCHAMVPALRPLWQQREQHEADLLTTATQQAGVNGADADLGRGEKAVRLAEDFLTFHLVRHADRVLDLVWNMVVLVMVTALLLMASCNSYPFQPTGLLSQWMMVVVVASTVPIILVLVGMQKDPLISRVKKTPFGGSIWNLEFLSKLMTYVAPVLALLATLLYGFYDTLLVILGPFLH